MAALVLVLAALAFFCRPVWAGFGSPEVGAILADKYGCPRCHGPAGQSSEEIIPDLAGQNARYLAKQLFAFRDSGLHRPRGFPLPERHDGSMDRKAMDLSDGEIDDLAAYFASLSCRAENAMPDAPMPDLARRCFTCHGRAGRTRYRDLPNLAGQNAGYMARQLFVLRESAWDMPLDDPRRKRLHPMMTPQADMIDDANIYNLSAYFSVMSCF